MPQRILICLLLLLLSPGSGRALAEEALTEPSAKAGFIFNFAKFVEWPADAFSKDDSPLVVGIFGDEDFVTAVRKLFEEKNPKAHGRSFMVRRLTQNGDAKACHILFFRESETKRFGAIYESIKRCPIMTIGESDEFLDFGGMFNFVFEEKQLRFEVNTAPAENAGLTISSKLLHLARKVRKGGTK
jgi:hypothetical protein